MFCFLPKHNIACLMKIQNYESKNGAITAINLLHARMMLLVYPATQDHLLNPLWRIKG